MVSPVPKDSRYIPLTQQKSCCVPTCIQMVMLRHKIPLLPAEEIGYYLGLIVDPENTTLFYDPRTSKKRPPAGYGTRIYDPKYEPNKAFKKLNIPLSFKVHPITGFKSAPQLLDFLRRAETENLDMLLCFNHGVLVDNPAKSGGHVCVFDRVIDGQIRIIDPSYHHPKWRSVPAEKMFLATKKHGVKKSAGAWELTKL